MATLLIGFQVGPLCPLVPRIYENGPFAAPAPLVHDCCAQPTSEISGCRTIEYVRVSAAARSVIPASHHTLVPSLCRSLFESLNGGAGRVVVVVDAAQFPGQIYWARIRNFSLCHVRWKFKVGVESQFVRITGQLDVLREACPCARQVNSGNPLFAKCRTKSACRHGPLWDVSDTINQ